MTTAACAGCGGEFADMDGPRHSYMTSSPGCWRGYGELLGLDYGSPQRMAFHQVVVDAYAAQHPGSGALSQQINSVGLHLMTLCLFLERGTDPSLGAALHRRMIRKPNFHRLSRSGLGASTWQRVAAADSLDDVREAVDAWARDVWLTYQSEHATVRMWLGEAGFTGEQSDG